MASVAVTGRADLTDAQWAIPEPLLPEGKKPGRPPRWTSPEEVRQIVVVCHAGKATFTFDCPGGVSRTLRWRPPRQDHESHSVTTSLSSAVFQRSGRMVMTMLALCFGVPLRYAIAASSGR